MSTAEMLTQTLRAASMADRDAAQLLDQWRDSNFGAFGLALANEISAPGKEQGVRQMAGLYLKNMLYAKGTELLTQNLQRWKNLPPNERQAIKDALLKAFGSDESAPFAAGPASEIAAVELPYQEWDSFVPTMTERIQSQGTANSAGVPKAALQCLGYTMERIEKLEEAFPDMPAISSEVVDAMLTPIVGGMHASKDNIMRLEATKALRNSLIYVKKNMGVKSERDAIMTAICGGTQSEDPSLRQLAFVCMYIVAENYYDILNDYMTAFFQLTTSAIGNDKEDENVRMAAIEFWDTICKYEQDLLDEENDYQERGKPLDRPPCPKYIQSAMSNLVPLLLQTLTKQEETVDNDEWNLQSAGATCLQEISSTVESMIVPLVMPFVEQNITSQDWRFRDAAINAFASILEGPDTSVIGQYVSQAIPVLLSALADVHLVVQDSATNCLGIIGRYHLSAVPPDQVQNILQGLINKLQPQVPARVASHACTAIYNIGQALKPDSRSEVSNTNILSAPMLALLQALLAAAEREDAPEGNLMISAFSAAGELVGAAAADMENVLSEFAPYVLQKTEEVIRMPSLTRDDLENKEMKVELLFGLMNSVLARSSCEGILPYADRIMNLIVEVSKNPNAASFEEAIFAGGHLARLLEEGFQKYLQAYMGTLMIGLRDGAAVSVFKNAVGNISDLCLAVGDKLQPYCNDMVGALKVALEDPKVNRDAKPLVISSLGDIAMAIGAAYEPYLQISVMMLMQASQIKGDPDDDELGAFISELRLAILEGYSGIIMGLEDGKILGIFEAQIPAVLQFLDLLANESDDDEDVMTAAAALIGDISRCMAGSPIVQQHMRQPCIFHIIQRAGSLDDEKARETANYAHAHVQNIVSVTG